jgi:hypothetical protein
MTKSSKRGYRDDIRRMKAIAETSKAEVEIKDFTNVPLEVCIQRDADRHKKVGEAVIRDMYNKYILADNGYKYVYPVTPGLPGCIIVDIDGTIAKANNRKPFEYHKVITDTPRMEVINAVKALSSAHSYHIIVVSGREDIAYCREDTGDWLTERALLPYHRLYMREKGDHRPDFIVKQEIFDKYIKNQYNVFAVFDDRPQVINKTWRACGLQEVLFDVGYGVDF